MRAATTCSVGDVSWLSDMTGWSHDRIARLARQGVIPGAYQTKRGIRGSQWAFKKEKVENWLNSQTN